MTLLLEGGVAEAVLRFPQPPLQALRPLLLLLRLALRLLLQPLRHPWGQTGSEAPWPPASTRSLRLLLLLVVDVSQAPAAQVAAGLPVGGLLDLSAQSSQHGAEPCKRAHVTPRSGPGAGGRGHTSFATAEARLQVIDGSRLQRLLRGRQAAILDHVEV